MANETDQGGVVTYIYKDDRGPMNSRYRASALDAIKQKCPAGYSIMREGEAKAAQGISTIEGEEDVRGHRWGLQFVCKPQ